MKNRKLWTGVVLAAVLLLSSAAGFVFAEGSVKATGTLSEVRENGTVIIDDHGYELSSSVIIVDGQGKRISLKELELPAVVKYEYKYRANYGPVIILIHEVPQ